MQSLAKQPSAAGCSRPALGAPAPLGRAVRCAIAACNVALRASRRRAAGAAPPRAIGTRRRRVARPPPPLPLPPLAGRGARPPLQPAPLGSPAPRRRAAQHPSPPQAVRLARAAAVRALRRRIGRRRPLLHRLRAAAAGPGGAPPRRAALPRHRVRGARGGGLLLAAGCGAGRRQEGHQDGVPPEGPQVPPGAFTGAIQHPARPHALRCAKLCPPFSEPCPPVAASRGRLRQRLSFFPALTRHSLSLSPAAAAARTRRM